MSLVTEMMLLNTEESDRELRMYYDIKKYVMTIYTVVMFLFDIALNTAQRQWTFQIYIQGVTPTLWFEYQTQNKTR